MSQVDEFFWDLDVVDVVIARLARFHKTDRDDGRA